MQKQNRYFHTLDALRGIAAVIVVIHHAGIKLFDSDPLPFSFAAVDVFFMLSGIVIAINYDRRLKVSMSPAEFMQRRLIRLYPLYFLGLLFAIITAASTGGENFAHSSSAVAWTLTIAAGILFIPSFLMSRNREAFPLNYPAWSLFFELIINFVYALAFRFITVQRLAIFAAANIVLYAITVRYARTPDIGWGQFYVFAGFFRVGYAFSLGIIVARAAPLKVPLFSNLGALAICAMLVVMLALPIYSGRQLPGIFIVAVAAPALVLAACKLEPRNAHIRRIFDTLGRISYPLYTIHAPIIYYVSASHMANAKDQTSTIAILVIALSILSLILDRLFDVPIRKWLSGFLSQKRLGETVEKPKSVDAPNSR